jgi:hypothetical protein
MLAGEDVKVVTRHNMKCVCRIYHCLLQRTIKIIVLDVVIVGSPARQIYIVYIQITACRPVAK